MLAAQRSVWASTAVTGAASRHRSVWWSSTTPTTRRWLATTEGDGHRDRSGSVPTKAADVKNETHAQKNKREFALLPTLLKTFEEATGHRVVPYHFFIPHADVSIVTSAANIPTFVFGRVGDVREIAWPDESRGMNFGRVLEKLVRNLDHQRKHPAVARTLDEMGFPLTPSGRRQLAWDHQIMAALKTFFRIHEHTLVPVDFEVPRGDTTWPVATWGYNLGARVDFLRQSKNELSDSELADLKSVEFSFDFWETMWSERLLPSLETYASVHHNCRVPHSFQVPHEAPWPRKAWGLQLGDVVSSIRSNGYYATQIKRDMGRLETIHFVWDDLEYQWSERVLPSLETFYQVHGHNGVSQNFVVPSEAPWPRVAWGLRLGTCVGGIRSRDVFSQQTKRDATRLEAIEFVWDHREHKWNNVILPALEAFAQVFRHCDVPQSFVVPSESPWPREVWGFNLGSCVATIRSQGHYSEQTERDATRLEAIRFVWEHLEHKWSNIILPSLKMFARVFGYCDVPRSFVVPHESPWPEEAWGLRLGGTVANMKSRGDFHTQVQRDASELEAIDFVLNHRQYKWDKALLLSLEVFYTLHGHTRVPTKFVVPSELPWPNKAWGLRLGAAVNRIHRNGTYAEFIKRDEDRLRAIGFVVKCENE